jgi:hypothetical protein
MKDPILQTYTLEELAYEYYLVGEREAYKQEQASEEADKIEEVQQQAAMDWADEEEALEEAELAAKQAEEEAKQAYDPLKDPKNIEWMEAEMEKSKLIFGEDFGEDLNLDFDGDDK